MSVAIDWNKIKIYVGSILLPVALGALTGIVISGSMDYEMLNKPALSPPSALFPIVWTALYVLMGVSYGMLKSKGLLESGVSAVYYAQLTVNLLWPVFFFVFKWRLFAFIWIIALAALVMIMTAVFYKRDKTAGLLQLPYVAWTLFASYLNLFAFLLN